MFLALENYRLYDVYQTQGNKYMAYDIAQLLAESIDLADYVKDYISGSYPYSRFDTERFAVFCDSIKAYVEDSQLCRLVQNITKIKCNPISHEAVLNIFNTYNNYIQFPGPNSIDRVLDMIKRMGCYDLETSKD